MALECRDLVARKGKVIYQKSFGYQTLRGSKLLIRIYDVVLLTKICPQHDQQHMHGLDSALI
jgi:hypothetical protein